METTWQYRNRYREATFSPAGQPVFDCGLRTTRRATVTTAAIYHDRTWWRTPGPGPAHKLTVNFGGHVATAAGIVGRGYRWHPGPSWPVAILRDLATHRYQRVDGVNALKLAGVGATADAPDAIWVDPATYLPVRTVGTLTLIPSRHQPGQSKPGYRWLKPTPANLAQLAVRIPAGFTRVGAP